MDRSRKLVPEEFTHLYHTTCYKGLSEVQRLKYNQLYGLRINEQFIQFEEIFIGGVIHRLKRHRALKDDSWLLSEMESVLQDEQQHTLMFTQYNRGLRPELYRHSNELFTLLSTVERSLFTSFLTMPGLLPGLLWLLLAMEELTTAISCALIDHPHSDELETDYIKLHRYHFHDEQRHVGIDRKMIRMIYHSTPAPLQRLNAMLFRYVFQNILRPRRSTLEVICQLVREESELKAMEEDMIKQVMALAPNTAFPANLVLAEKLPVLHDLGNKYPEYRLPMMDSSSQY
ncbi:MAG: diiron oxygenase [Candidatus Thiodiazotropha sp.]